MLLYSAFISEIYRAALEAVPRGQREAGLALGMNRTRVFVQVVLPQATKIAIPNIGSMFIGMVKDTSVFTVIGLLEVVRVTQNLNSLYFQPFVFFTAAAVIYVVIAFVLDFLFRGIERVLATPPKGRIARAVTARRRRRVELRRPARRSGLWCQMTRADRPRNRRTSGDTWIGAGSGSSSSSVAAGRRSLRRSLPPARARRGRRRTTRTA